MTASWTRLGCIRTAKMREALADSLPNRYCCARDSGHLVAENVQSEPRQVSPLFGLICYLRRGSLSAIRAADYGAVHVPRVSDLLGTLHQNPGQGSTLFEISPAAIVSTLLESVANEHSLNTDTAGKVRSILRAFYLCDGQVYFHGYILQARTTPHPAYRFLNRRLSRSAPLLPHVQGRYKRS